MAHPSVEELARRVLSRCEPDGAGCLIFTGSLAKGYGRVGYYSDDKKQVVLQAHRVVWEAEHGPIPDDLTIDHVKERCHSRACQDTSHMELVTRGENTARASRGWRVTHCPKGHEYTEENTYMPPSGGRFCRECGRAANARSYAKRKAQA